MVHRFSKKAVKTVWNHGIDGGWKTVIIILNHQGWHEPSWHMEINLEQICNLVGSKVQVQNSSGKWVYKDAYPTKSLKTVLKLIFQECSQDEIENVQRYLNKHNKKCASEFQKICSKGR